MMNRMMKYFYALYLVFSISNLLFANSFEKIEKEGIVTYKSSQNVYVKFENTDGISPGDSLFQKANNKFVPAIIVRFISTKSVAGEVLNDIDLKPGEKLYAVIEKEIREEVAEQNDVIQQTVIPVSQEVTGKNKTPGKSKPGESELSGRFSIQSYSNISNSQYFADNQRWRYSFDFNARNIGGSGLSFSNYVTFAYRADRWAGISDNFGRSLRVYDVALNYDFSKKTSLWLGRHLNRKISNISSVDGLQFETGLKENFIGIVAGSRPNFTDLGFNFKLFEYGIYLGREDSLSSGYMSNTLAFFEQTNDFKTDRRFLYFQHANSIIPNTNIFVSTEVDMFKQIHNENIRSKYYRSLLFPKICAKRRIYLDFSKEQKH